MKKIIIISILMVIQFLTIFQTQAWDSKDKSVTFEVEFKKVNRKEALEKFFEKYNSPLKDNADTFIMVADTYNIDYRLIPSISCMESTCGKFLIEGSYNPFGWGIYGNNVIYFKDYNEAIETVGNGLNKGYFAKGYNTVEKIAPIYTPPNSTNWRNGVTFFMNEISRFE
jgi:hypothetical protein